MTDITPIQKEKIMQIASGSSVIQNLYMHKLSGDEVKKIKQQIVDNANKYTFTDFSKFKNEDENLSVGEKIQKSIQEFQEFLYSNGIDGKSVKRVSELNLTQASFFDVKV